MASVENDKIPRFKLSLGVGEVLAATCRGIFDRRGEKPVEAFTAAFSRYIGVSHAVLAPSGRGALASILHALQLPKGGEIILPSLTFHSIPATVLAFGLKPRFIDIDPGTFCMDTKYLEGAITPATVGILPVHLYGRSCNMGEVGRVAKQFGLVVIEDCAQAC